MASRRFLENGDRFLVVDTDPGNTVTIYGPAETLADALNEAEGWLSRGWQEAKEFHRVIAGEDRFDPVTEDVAAHWLNHEWDGFSEDFPAFVEIEDLEDFESAGDPNAEHRLNAFELGVGGQV